MELSDHEVTITTGRRAQDGRLRVSVFADQLLALGIEGQGERVPTLLLTLEQAKQLREALAQLIALSEEGEAAANVGLTEAWQGVERRTATR